MRLFDRPDCDASVGSRIVHQKRSFRSRELMVSLNSLVAGSTGDFAVFKLNGCSR